jgi:hypothetical protein
MYGNKKESRGFSVPESVLNARRTVLSGGGVCAREVWALNSTHGSVNDSRVVRY